jgi:uncharacterized membrane protein YphA (DoxX/SURF4 family)
MNNLTRFFLVLTRLAIGWLFLVEGYEKVHSVEIGPTTTSMPFTSAGYLKQASGPTAPFFYWQAGGDDDAHALERLTLDPDTSRPPRDRVSAALRKDWEQYLERFADHFQLDGGQREAARQKLDESLDKAVVWLTDSTHPQELEKNAAFATAGFSPWKAPVQRIAEYRTKVEQYRHAQDDVNSAFNADVYKAKLRAMKADAAKLRTALLADLDAPMHKELESVLNDDQKKMAALGPPSPPPVLVWIDRLVRYGLLVIGAGLMLGAFTRLNCLGGALFLIMLYVAMPPLPWSPELLRSETTGIPYVNKNLIIALALLALATTRSGLWFGLDGLLQFLNPWTYRTRKARPEPAAA